MYQEEGCGCSGVAISESGTRNMCVTAVLPYVVSAILRRV